MGGIAESISSFLLGPKDSGAPDIPEPAIPAAPAPKKREDSGAEIVVGADAVKDQRASGKGSSSSSSSGGDVLGGLGKGGLSI
jgi:hypothetical protein